MEALLNLNTTVFHNNKKAYILCDYIDVKCGTERTKLE